MRFGGRVYLCATEHLRGVTPDEADRLGIDARGQLDELLRAAQEVPENYEDLTTSHCNARHSFNCLKKKYEDLTSQPGPPVEVLTDPQREREDPSRDGLDHGIDAVEQMTPLEEAQYRSTSRARSAALALMVALEAAQRRHTTL